MKKNYNAMEAVFTNQAIETKNFNVVAMALSVLATGVMMSALSALFG